MLIILCNKTQMFGAAGIFFKKNANSVNSVDCMAYKKCPLSQGDIFWEHLSL